MIITINNVILCPRSRLLYLVRRLERERQKGLKVAEHRRRVLKVP